MGCGKPVGYFRNSVIGARQHGDLVAPLNEPLNKSGARTIANTCYQTNFWGHHATSDVLR